MPQHILIVDDEPNILATVAPLLRGNGYEVLSAMTGRAGLDAVDRDKPDLIVLDLGLPDLDGIDVCRQVRHTSRAPIIVLSARGAEGDKVAALDAGADDYVTKPFGAEELLARIRAALRRSDSTFGTAGPIIRGGLKIDRERFRVLTHRAILKAIWGPHATDQPEHLRVLVGSLRKKIELNPSAPKYILTEPWVGYRFADLP